MVLRVRRTDLFVLNMRTRMPFRYGIATLVALPHLFLKLELEISPGGAGGGAGGAGGAGGGGTAVRRTGLAADHLPPKWFTKHPHTHVADDVAEMIDVIRSACAIAATKIGPCGSVFELWQKLSAEQAAWAARAGGAGGAAGPGGPAGPGGAAKKKYPPLLYNFGVSLVERAVIDAFCRAFDHSFAVAVRENTLGIDLGALHAELSGLRPADLLPPAALRSITVRHTVGLSDPLTDAEIPLRERLHDGLPQSLDAAVRAYGLTHFKIKLSGNGDKDLHRLRDIAKLLAKRNLPAAFTLDANENYTALEGFRELWEKISADPQLAEFLRRLLFVEQPLHRDVALAPGTCGALLAWPQRPAMIIDESDGRIENVRDALACGYIGTSFKSCKGIIKGIGAACLIAHRNRTGAAGRWVLSAEDLSTVGPVSLPQDLCAIATLGIGHAERNGYHYFRGMSAIPRGMQHELLAAHRDLWRDHEDGFATLNIQNGAVDVSSVVSHGFGLKLEFDPSIFIPLDQWDAASLNA